MAIPVYSFSGFLDAGKSRFIQETLCDERFNAGEKTLLLLCEEGEVEFDISAYPHQTVYVETVEQDAVTTEELEALAKKHRAERVVLELNGMQIIGDFYQKMPRDWEIAQEVMFADAGTILAYNQNMRALVVDKLSGCDMVCFNRVPAGADIMPFHRLARALNRKIDILYEDTDGKTQFDDIVDPLPFDLNAPVIEVRDEDYALFYRDMTEETKKYNGKTVRFKAQVAKLRKAREGYFAPGRFIMTCCEADIQFFGIPCRYKDSEKLKVRSWVTVTATIQNGFHPIYRGIGPVLTALSVEPAQPAEEDVCTF